jgi:epoxyqueuosine reductase
LKEKIRQYALSVGAHLVGFADADDLKEAPEGFRPTDIMPEVQSVIVLGKALTVGTVFSKNKAVYTMQGDTIVKDLDSLASQVAYFIERQGGLAMPIPTDAPYFYWDEERKHGMGILSHRHAAVKAGLGVIGKSALLITPEYGSRITLVTVLTDMKLAADSLTSNNLCPPACKRCVDACPTKALSGNGSVEQKLCRSHVGTTSDRGHDLVNCWNCRAMCPRTGNQSKNV